MRSIVVLAAVAAGGFYMGRRHEAVISHPSRVIVNVAELPGGMIRRIVREEMMAEWARLDSMKDLLEEAKDALREK